MKLDKYFWKALLKLFVFMAAIALIIFAFVLAMIYLSAFWVGLFVVGGWFVWGANIIAKDERREDADR
jgi:hypothetical protein